MKQMVCSVCTYTYDEAKGIPEAGIAPGTRWEDLPDDWRCPWCGAGKEMFREKDAASAAPVPEPAEKPHVEQELSPMELSIICSNLARGCEKQYLPSRSRGSGSWQPSSVRRRSRRRRRTQRNFWSRLRVICLPGILTPIVQPRRRRTEGRCGPWHGVRRSPECSSPC